MDVDSNYIDALSRALQNLEADLSPSESHGALTGMLCAKAGAVKQEWLKSLAPNLAAGDLLAREALELLGTLYDATQQRLNDPTLEFQPLLPPDEASLETRLAALAEWCQGFLMGMSEGGITDIDRLPTDSAEILRDLVEISRADAYELGEGEEDEKAYAELLEYVRTGVLLINEELNPTKAPPQGGDITYH